MAEGVVVSIVGTIAMLGVAATLTWWGVDILRRGTAPLSTRLGYAAAEFALAAIVLACLAGILFS